MSRTRRTITGGLIGVGLLLTAACGSSSSGSTAKADTTTTSGSGSTADCPATRATVTIRATGEKATFTHAGGVSLSNGAAYTVYLSDTPVDPDHISMVRNPEPKPGHHLATVALTVFNAKDTPPPIKAGTKIAFTPDFGVLTFRAIDATVDKTYAQEVNGKGDVEVTEVGSTLCFKISYTDEEKQLVGTVEAPVAKR